MKLEKNEHHYWILHIHISLSTNFQLKLTVAIFGPNLPKKGSYFQSKTDQIDRHHYWILHIRISLCIKFCFDKTILKFWTKFTQGRYLCSKTEKVNIIIEFRIFKLALVPNFSLTDRFDFFDQIYPKRVFFRSKTEKMNTTYFPHNSAYSNWSSAKFQLN